MTDREANDKLHDDYSGVQGLHRAISNLRHHGTKQDGAAHAATKNDRNLSDANHVVDVLFKGSGPDMRFVEVHAAGTDIGVSAGEWVSIDDEPYSRLRFRLAKGTSNEQIDRLGQYLMDEFASEIGREGEEDGAAGVAIRILDMAKELWTLASYLACEQVGEEVHERDAVQKAIEIMSKVTERQRLDRMDQELLDSAQALCQYLIGAFPDEARKSGGNTIGPALMASILERQERIIESLTQEVTGLRRKSRWKRLKAHLFGSPSTITPVKPISRYPFDCPDCCYTVLNEDDHMAHHAMTGH